MITDLKINEENKKRYYEQGYWTEKTVNDIWNDRVAAHPDREYISDDMGVRLTYAEIDDKAARLASWLREQGIQNGDVVTFQMPPWSEFAILYVAFALKVGAVIHPLAVTFNGEDLVYAMNLVESKAFIAPTFHHKTNFEDQIFSVVERIPSLPINAIAVHDKTVDAKSATTLKEIFEKYEPYTGEAGSKSDEVVLILSTSGTTGRPKAVLITHNALLFSERAFSTGLGLTKDDVHVHAGSAQSCNRLQSWPHHAAAARRSCRSRASLQPRRGDQPDEPRRRYLVDGRYAVHLRHAEYSGFN